MTHTIRNIIVLLAALLIVLLGAVIALMFKELGEPAGRDAVAQVTRPPAAETQAPTSTSGAALPPPALTVVPTDTAQPTDTPTQTPEATAVSPTETPAPANTAIPVVFVPTNTPAPPTSTPAPPTQDTRGITATDFQLQDRSIFAVNQPIWFQFTLANSAGGPVSFGSLGVMPRKDGVDRMDWYQHSYGGNNDAVPVNGMTWEDHIEIPEGGPATVRLVICFEGHQTCLNNQGQWVTLSAEIPVNIN
jgi:hypothetical protein